MKTYNSILLLDDDETAVSSHAYLLKELNISDHIIIKKNGFDVIHFLRRLANEGIALPELIIFDLNMRVMNGFEFLREFKNMGLNNAPVKVLALTSSPNSSHMVTIESLGVKCVKKPLTKEKVLACLDYKAG